MVKRYLIVQFLEISFYYTLILLVSSVKPPIDPDGQYQYAIHIREEDFYALLTALRNTMLSPGGPPSLRMSVGVGSDTKPEMVSALPGIQKAGTVDEVLSVLYLHCDFLNCELLCHICEHLENQQCQQRMSSYINNLENLNNFKLQVFMKVWRGIRRAPNDTSTLLSNQNMSWNDYTINDALRVKELICKKASIPTQLVRLESICDSDLAYVSVVWILPKSIADALKQGMSDKHGDKEFQQLAIDQLIVDGDPVYKAVTDQVQY